MKSSIWDTSSFNQFVEKLASAWKVPGVAIAVIDHDDIPIKNYGFVKLPAQSLMNSTLFDSASMSKPFTAAAVALFVQDDEKFPQVQWDTPVSTLLPEDFVMTDDMYTQNVTIEDILSHRSGIPDVEHPTVEGQYPLRGLHGSHRPVHSVIAAYRRR